MADLHFELVTPDKLVRSEDVSWVFVGITALATLTTTALLLLLGFRLYEREEILFPQ